MIRSDHRWRRWRMPPKMPLQMTWLAVIITKKKIQLSQQIIKLINMLMIWYNSIEYKICYKKINNWWKINCNVTISYQASDFGKTNATTSTTTTACRDVCPRGDAKMICRCPHLPPKKYYHADQPAHDEWPLRESEMKHTVQEFGHFDKKKYQTKIKRPNKLDDFIDTTIRQEISRGFFLSFCFLFVSHMSKGGCIYSW